MSRNKYEEALGVTRIRWTQGDPEARPYGTVLVEVWRSSLVTWRPERPEVTVRSQVQLRRFRSGQWQTLGHNGEWEVSSSQETVRRWALLPSREWYGNVTIDGWRQEEHK